MDNKTVNITVLCSYKFAIKSVESLANKHRIKSKTSREKGFWLLKTAKGKVESRQRGLINNERLIGVWLSCCLKNSFVCWVPEKLKLNAKSKNLKTPNGAMTYTMKEKKIVSKEHDLTKLITFRLLFFFCMWPVTGRLTFGFHFANLLWSSSTKEITKKWRNLLERKDDITSFYVPKLTVIWKDVRCLLLLPFRHNINDTSSRHRIEMRNKRAMGMKPKFQTVDEGEFQLFRRIFLCEKSVLNFVR